MGERVVLVNPPSAPGTTANREGAAGLGAVDPTPQGFFYPPHTVAAVAAVLREEGWRVRAIDATEEQLDVPGTLSALAHDREPVVGVLASYATLRADIAFLQALKRAMPDRRILVLGAATRYIHEIIRQQVTVDGILLGEPERAFGAACRALGREVLLSAATLKPEAYDADGFLRDLDSLPHPAWDLFPFRRYRLLTVIGSRGCGDSCRYCPYVAAQGARFRPRAVESVADELAWLEQTFAPSRIVFRDPVFAWDRARVVDLCEQLLERGVRTSWECESRPEHFDRELLRWMRRAGCTWIKIGLESASGGLLYRLRRLGSIEEAASYRTHVAEVVHACREIGLHCRVFILLGLPGETEEMRRETLRFVESLRPTALNVKRFEAYPGLRVSAAEQAAATPPDANTWQAFLEFQKRLERPLRRHGIGRRVRGWLSRRRRDQKE